MTRPETVLRCLLALSLSLLAGCEGVTSPQPDPDVDFTLDETSAVTQTVGVEGGTITAHSNGIDYDLVIPRGALTGDVSITMTPIASALNFPTSGGFAAGIDFAPSGLRFAQAARLRVRVPARPSGLHLIVTGYQADPDALLPLLSVDDGTVAEVAIAHFSGVAAGFGTSADLLTMSNPGPTTESSHYIAQLSAVSASGLTDAEQRTANTQIMVLWLTNVVQPRFAAASTDLELLLAISEFDLWSIHALDLGLTAALEADIGDTRAMAAIKLLVATDGNADRCGAQQSLAALYNVGFWYLQALNIGVALPEHFLDAQSLSQSIASRCLTVELESDTLATPMIVGTPYTLSLVWGIRFKGQGALQGLPLLAAAAPLGNATIGTGAGFTDIAGLFQTVFTAHAAGTIEFAVAACVPMPGLTPPPPPFECGELYVGESLVLERPVVDAVQVAISPSIATVAAGGTIQFTAEVTGANNQDVDWTATGGTMSDSGLFTADSVAGTFSVTATSVAVPSAFDVATITISASTGVARVSSNASVTATVVNVGESGACGSIFSPAGATTWVGNRDCTGTIPDGGGVARATFSMSFTETHLGGRLLAVTASGQGTASASGSTSAGGSAAYHLEFNVEQAMDVTFDAALNTERGLMYLQKANGDALVWLDRTGSVNQRFTLTPGLWVVHITAANIVPTEPASTSFQLDLRFH